MSFWRAAQTDIFVSWATGRTVGTAARARKELLSTAINYLMLIFAWPFGKRTRGHQCPSGEPFKQTFLFPGAEQSEQLHVRAKCKIAWGIGRGAHLRLCWGLMGRWGVQEVSRRPDFIFTKPFMFLTLRSRGTPG